MFFKKITFLLLSFYLIMSCKSSSNSDTKSHADEDIYQAAFIHLESNPIEIFPNNNSTFFLCVVHKASSPAQLKRQIKYLVLDQNLKVVIKTTILTDGEINWLDNHSLKTIQKMGIAQNGSSNVIVKEINIPPKK